MKNLFTSGFAVCVFLVLFGCAHAPDIAGVPEEQQIAAAHGTCPLPCIPAELAGAPTEQEIAEARTNGAPAVEIPETTFDFGLVSQENTYIHAFKIRNIGTGVLRIKKIMPG